MTRTPRSYKARPELYLLDGPEGPGNLKRLSLGITDPKYQKSQDIKRPAQNDQKAQILRKAHARA